MPTARRRCARTPPITLDTAGPICKRQNRPHEPDPGLVSPSPHRVTPSHRLITGPRAALELALAQAVKDAKADDPFAAVTVLVGETLLRPYLRRRIAEILGGHVNVEIVTPGELAMTLGSPALLAAGRQPMPPLLDPVLVRQATAQAPDRFAKVVHTPGFENALIRTLRDVRGAGIVAEHLMAAGAAVSDARFLDLAALYTAVEQRRDGWFTVEDAIVSADPPSDPTPGDVAFHEPAGSAQRVGRASAAVVWIPLCRVNT